MGAKQDIGISAPEKSSLGKGETLADTIDTYVGYGANFIVIRDPREGSSRWAKICALKSYSKRIREYAFKNRKFPSNITLPVILNGGDGSNNHPSQHLLDCATMKYFLGRFDNLNIGIINDVGASRVFSSQIDAAKILNWKIYLCKSPRIKLSERNMQRIKDTGVEIKEFENFKKYLECLKDLDALYVHRFQKNLREGESAEQEMMQKISKELLEKNGFSKNAILMHARPVDKEVKEISDCLRYHQWNKSGIQSDLGIPTRMAIAYHVIEKNLFSLDEIIKTINYEDFNYFKKNFSEIPPKSKTREEYTTAFIKNGYVIDHIPLGCGSKVHEMISKKYPEATVILSSNVNSERKNYKRKDVIKIHGDIEWDNEMDGIISIFTDPDEEKSCRISYFQNGKRENKLSLIHI